jgi:hypothetical protein
MPHEIKAWRCDHCKRHNLTRRAIMKHEEGCIANPENRACATCMHDSDEGLDGFSCQAGVNKRGKRVVRQCAEWACVSSQYPETEE